MRRLAALLLCSILAALPWVSAAPAQAARPAPRPPTSMAAIGDSITQAVDACCWYGNHPANSWSTGGAGWDGVLSHYERIRALDPAITDRNYNNAASGAKMGAGPAQARRAVEQRVRYVTILLGANDACTSSPSTMTSVDTFRGQYRETLAILISGLPARARIYVSSIPDVHQLWEIYHQDPVAQWVWETAGICQSLLDPQRTAEERQAVRARVIAFNDVLATECAQYARCRFDGNAVFNYQFERSDVSRLDYFHPSLSGQADLARISWAASWWG